MQLLRGLAAGRRAISPDLLPFRVQLRPQGAGTSPRPSFPFPPGFGARVLPAQLATLCARTIGPGLRPRRFKRRFAKAAQRGLPELEAFASEFGLGVFILFYLSGKAIISYAPITKCIPH